MKALSLTQPWATLVAIGAKRIETRSWATAYRGPLLIHAAKGFPKECQALCFEEPFFSALKFEHHQSDPDLLDAREFDLPLGAILCRVDLTHVLDTGACTHGGLTLGPHEKAFGDFSAGRFGWLLKNLRTLSDPIPAKGALGLWEFPDRLLPEGFAA